MRDVNSILIKAYFDAISAAVTVGCYEHEEPDNLTDPVYIVLSDVTSRDTSTMNTDDLQLSITVTVHSWKMKYNNSDDLNIVCGQVIEALKPTPTAVLNLGSDLQMTNLRLTSDLTQRYGELAGRKFISRLLTFEQNIYLK